MKFNYTKWAGIAVATSVLATAIGILLKKKKRKSISDDLEFDVSSSKKVDTKTNDLIQDIFKAESLYKKLITKVHPDRFIDEDKKQLAEELSKEITKNKHSYSKLLDLEAQVNVLFSS